MSGRKFLTYLAMAAMVMMLAGCATLTQDSFGSPAGGYSPTGVGGNVSSAGLYYEFSDVLIPYDMRVDKNATFVTRAPNFAAGVLSVKGKIEINSLISYFVNSMAKDGWTLITSFKSPRTVLLFHKESRWCVINIAERDFNTYADIAVMPGGSSGGSPAATTAPPASSVVQPLEEPLYR